MKDSVRFTLNDTEHTLDGWPEASAQCPVDQLARYVINAQRAMWDDLNAERSPRPVPLSFAVEYDDGLTITYKVQSVLRDNQRYDCCGMLIVE